MKIKFVLNVISSLIMVTGLFMSSCIFVSWYYGDDMVVTLYFVESAIITFFSGVILFYYTRGKEKIRHREGFAIISLSWIAVACFGSLPYIYICKMSFVDAIFETMSGITTTGFSVIDNVEAMPKSILFWRALTNWYGGMGIVIFSIAVLPALGIVGLQLYKTESTGPVNDQLTSRVATSAKFLWLIYLGLSLLLICILHFLNLSWFDSICHAFSTMATGGFPTKNNSIAAFSDSVKIVISIFMFLSAISFTLHIKALKGEPLCYFKNEEFRYFFFTNILLTILVTFILTSQDFYSLKNSFIHAFFQINTIMTCTGFSSTNFTQWPLIIQVILFFLMFIGGCGGSTAGGIKISRIIILIKHTWSQMISSISPHSLANISLDKNRINNANLQNVLSFFFAFCFIWVISSLLLTLNEGIDLSTSFSVTISCLSNIGTGLSKVGPNNTCSWLADGSKWLLTSIMLIGRLEIYTVLILFLPSFWSKNG